MYPAPENDQSLPNPDIPLGGDSPQDYNPRPRLTTDV